MATITLFQFASCPFCQRVRQQLDELKMQYTTKEVSRDRNSQERKTLLQRSGVSTVPVMQIDGQWIGDSQKIISYLNNRK